MILRTMKVDLFDLILEQLYFQNIVLGYSGVSARQKLNLRLFGVNDVIQEFLYLITDT